MKTVEPCTNPSIDSTRKLPSTNEVKYFTLHLRKQEKDAIEKNILEIKYCLGYAVLSAELGREPVSHLHSVLEGRRLLHHQPRRPHQDHSHIRPTRGRIAMGIKSRLG